MINGDSAVNVEMLSGNERKKQDEAQDGEHDGHLTATSNGNTSDNDDASSVDRSDSLKRNGNECEASKLAAAAQAAFVSTNSKQSQVRRRRKRKSANKSAVNVAEE